MNRVDLQLNLQAYFNNPTYYQGVDFNDSIQDGLDEVVAISGASYGTGTLAFQQYLTYYDMLTLFPDYIGIIGIFNQAIKRWMLPTSMTKLDNDRIDWETAFGTPYYFVPVTHRYVAIYKKPGTAGYGNMSIFYRSSAPILNDSTIIPLPDDHTIALENYVRTDLWEQNQEWGKAGIALESYTHSIEALKLTMNSRNSGRIRGLR